LSLQSGSMSMLIAFVAAAVAPDDVAVAMVELAISMSKRKLQGSKLLVDFERRASSRDAFTSEFEVDFFCSKSVKGIRRYCYRDQEV
jgi:hypothetical protein